MSRLEVINRSPLASICLKIRDEESGTDALRLMTSSLSSSSLGVRGGAWGVFLRLWDRDFTADSYTTGLIGQQYKLC